MRVVDNIDNILYLYLIYKISIICLVDVEMVKYTTNQITQIIVRKIKIRYLKLSCCKFNINNVQKV